MSYITHGGYGTRENSIWRAMRNRCNNPNNAHYVDYGGRGIYVCAEWDTFSAFLKDMGKAPTPQHTLERVNNDGPYSPDNCKWATRLEQSNNQRSTRLITHDGETHSVSEWARRLGLPRGRIQKRAEARPNCPEYILAQKDMR